MPSWETIPFHFSWISLTLVYGFRGWDPGPTAVVLGLVIVGTGTLILSDAFSGDQLWGELFDVPLMSAMFLAMVWHARRRQDALGKLEEESRERAQLLAQQKRFLHDVSHELRDPRVELVVGLLAEALSILPGIGREALVCHGPKYASPPGTAGIPISRRAPGSKWRGQFLPAAACRWRKRHVSSRCSRWRCATRSRPRT